MEIVDINPENFVYDYDIINNDKDHFDYYKKYYNLHTEFLRPLNIKININLFEKEIKQYHTKFRRWGSNRNHLPRYGISLVNYDGNIDGKYDIACGPLDQYNSGKHHTEHLWDDAFTKKTEVFYNLQSMRPLDCIKNFLVRSTINLKHKHGNFVPHFDTMPKPNIKNLRLWGSNTSKGIEYKFLGNTVIDIEPGRLYLIDTTQWHYIISHKDWVYTFFIALNNSQETFNWLKNNLI